MKIITSLLALVIGAAVMLGVIEVGRADTPSPVRLAQATGSGSGTVTILAFESPKDAPATETSTAAPAPAPVDTTPKLEDASLLAKMWKGKSFLGFAILAVYLGLFAWAKLDKKRAFYSATALAGVVLLVDMLRKGETVNINEITNTLGPTLGLLIAGPNHVKAGS